jgi:hypothetical protein
MSTMATDDTKTFQVTFFDSRTGFQKDRSFVDCRDLASAEAWGRTYAKTWETFKVQEVRSA